MKTASEIRVNDVIIINGKLLKVEEIEIKGAAKAHKTINLKMRDVIEHKFVQHTFLQEDKIENAQVLNKKTLYSYKDGESFCFMDEESFENYSIPKEMIGNMEIYLKENAPYYIMIHENNPIGIAFPERVKLKVTTAPSGIKSSESTTPKRVTLENGMEIDTPQFIEENDIVEVSTSTSKYIDRVLGK
ncbi:MAG: hypothetical protein PHQ52_03755 [Candidatus Omnitrophica bacterium]|nr:hypothetical protein [Candidatus Omnitrophota bacterium]